MEWLYVALGIGIVSAIVQVLCASSEATSQRSIGKSQQIIDQVAISQMNELRKSVDAQANKPPSPSQESPPVFTVLPSPPRPPFTARRLR
jgi:hypothetical protein